jgi:hypothetical protein
MRNRSEKSVAGTLARLGVEEVSERLEISPLLATDDPAPEDPDDGDCCCRCVCKLVPIDLPGSS